MTEDQDPANYAEIEDRDEFDTPIPYPDEWPEDDDDACGLAPDEDVV